MPCKLNGLNSAICPILLQRGIDRDEFGVKPGAKAIDDSYDREADPGSNQPAFDGYGTGLVSNLAFHHNC